MKIDDPQAALYSRASGAMLGLALGDALGAPVEFRVRGSFEPVTTLRGAGTFGLEAGQFTDDTSQALCLADSLLETRTFDPLDQIERFCRWWKTGYNGVTGHCFDIGHATRSALMKFELTGEPMAGSRHEYSAGNGSLMRLAPVPIRYHHDARAAVTHSGESSRTTHGAEECISACRYLGGLVHGALNGHGIQQLLAERYQPFPGCWDEMPLSPKIAAIADGSFREKCRDEILSSGYVVDTLEAALWALWHHDGFAEGALAAVNLGDDADTVGAVYGQLAGALHGEQRLPREWLEQLAWKDRIATLARELADLGRTTGNDNLQGIAQVSTASGYASGQRGRTGYGVVMTRMLLSTTREASTTRPAMSISKQPITRLSPTSKE